MDTDRAPSEVQTGAIRMMAFGVLDYVPTPSIDVIIKSRKSGASEMVFDQKQIDRNREIEKLVLEEFHNLGWIVRAAVTKFGAQSKAFVLLGKLGGSGTWPVRPKIGEGDLVNICRAAVAFIDGIVPECTLHHTD